MSYEKLDSKILEMQDEIVKSIQESVQIDSVKSDPLPGAPYGAGCKEALLHALALGEKLGFRTGNVGDRVGWVEYGEGEEMIGVLGHLDVVPVGEGWTYPAFGGEIHDGVLYGRGVVDDKGPVVGAMYALKAIKDLNLPLNKRIRVLFGTDEENGSSCVHYYIENGGELPSMGFTPDADYPLIFCEKGMHTMTLGKKNPVQGEKTIRFFEGGTAANVVTPSCRLEVDGDVSVLPTEGVTVKKDGNLQIVEAIGKGAHGSTPEKGINAAVRLSEALKEEDLGGDFQNMMNFIRNRLKGETNGKTLGICYQDEETGETTVNLGLLKFTPEMMSLTLDIRFPKNGVPETIYENVKKAAEEEGMEVLEDSFVPVLYIPKDSVLVKTLLKVFREETGLMMEPLAIGGGTYAKAFQNMVAFGPEFPGVDNAIHQPNERVELTRLIKSCQIMAAAMYELAK